MSSPNLLERHKIEIICGSLAVALAAIAGKFNVSTDTAWLAGTLMATLALSVAIIKEHISNEIDKVYQDFKPIGSKCLEISDILASIGGENYKLAYDKLENFVQELRQIKNGHLPLSEWDYYARIIDRMNSMPSGANVYATSSIDERRWSDDPRQLNYMSANNEAVSRGVEIHRIFIIEKNKINNPAYIEALQEIDRQMSNKMLDVKAVWREQLPNIDFLYQDWVLFDDHDPEVFRAFGDSIDKTRVSHAELIKGHSEDGTDNIDKYKKAYQTLLSFTLNNNVLKNSIKITNTNEAFIEKDIKKSYNDTPSNSLTAYNLDKPVITCEQAAAAKGISLSSELKTIIILADEKIYAVNVPGNLNISLRKIKKFLDCDQAFMIDRVKLNDLGLVPGTVCPVKDPVWNMPQLLDESVLHHKFVSTNNGSLLSYFMFHPKILLSAPNIQIGDFSTTSE